VSEPFWRLCRSFRPGVHVSKTGNLMLSSGRRTLILTFAMPSLSFPWRSRRFVSFFPVPIVVKECLWRVENWNKVSGVGFEGILLPTFFHKFDAVWHAKN
jgi:hypothetical protein